jgi:hypothetical protein
MRISRDLMLIVVLFAVLLVIMFFVLPRLGSDSSPDVPYSTYSKHFDGLNLFYKLVQKSGFRVERIRADPYRLPENLTALFLVEPSDPLNTEALDELRAFVERGGILIAAGTDTLDPLLRDYGLETVNTEKHLAISQRLSPEPFFQRMPVERFTSSTDWAIRPIEREVAPLFGVGFDYSVATFRLAEGRIFLLSCPYILTPAGLEHQENATLIYNLLTYLPHKARVGFDEYHHGYRVYTETRRGSDGMIRRLLRTPIGWAILYAGLLVFVFLILRGRRFGQPLEIDESRRRLTSEYVLAMVDLYRKSRKGTAILTHLRTEFRRKLASRWHIDPTLDIPTFVQELAKRKPIDTEELQTLLEDLQRATPTSEARLLELTRRVEAFLKEMS